MKFTTKDMIISALFSGLTVIGAKVNLLLPDVPITLQPVIVMLAGSLLGSRIALLSQVVYVSLGLIGIPVFSKPIAGPAYLLTPSFGYLIGFIAAAYVIGLIIERSSKRTTITFIFANMAGLGIIYISGVFYMYILMNLYLNKTMTLMKAVTVGVGFAIVKDIIAGILISALSSNIYSRIRVHLKNSY